MSQQTRMSEVTVCDLCDQVIADDDFCYPNIYKLKRKIVNVDIYNECVSSAVYAALIKGENN